MSDALFKALSNAFKRGSDSVTEWVKKYHADFSANDIETALIDGSPTATSFMRFQSFTTAVVQNGRIREQIHEALNENLKAGKDMRSFENVVNDVFDKAGLTRLKDYQIENIYTTNTSMAYGAAQMAKMVELKDDFPYWKYNATMDGKTRPSHAALHGKIFRTGDFTFFPPIGYRCRCTAIPLTGRAASRYLKSDMPDNEEKEKLMRSLTNHEFVGNKQQKFMEWLADEYKNADSDSRKLIDEALDNLKKDIADISKNSGEEFLNDDRIKDLRKEYIKNKEVRKAIKDAGLTDDEGLHIYAYTDFKNGISSSLASIHYNTGVPPTWSRAQLDYFKKKLSEVIEKLPRNESLVFRNLKDVPDDVINQFKKNDIIMWDTFSSTTYDTRTYEERPLRFKIKQNSARKIDVFSKYPDEKEALLPAETRLKVVDVKKDNNQITITLEEI